MIKFFEMYLPILALLLSPILIPTIGWVARTVKDLVLELSK